MAARVLRELVNARVASALQVTVSAEAARRFLVARHFLSPARSVEGGTDAVLQVLRKFGSIQFDPIAVAGRCHDLAAARARRQLRARLVRLALRTP